MLFRIAGFSFFGDFFWRQGTRKPGSLQVDDGMGGTMPAPIERPRNGLGWTTQASLLIPHVPLEIGGRYSGIRDWDRAPASRTSTRSVPRSRTTSRSTR